jgi:hypothetical protein
VSDPLSVLRTWSVCPSCHGERVIECSGVHPSRPAGGLTAMEQPDTWTERCDACRGEGIVVTESDE